MKKKVLQRVNQVIRNNLRREEEIQVRKEQFLEEVTVKRRITKSGGIQEVVQRHDGEVVHETGDLSHQA